VVHEGGVFVDVAVCAVDCDEESAGHCAAGDDGVDLGA